MLWFKINELRFSKSLILKKVSVFQVWTLFDWLNDLIKQTIRRYNGHLSLFFNFVFQFCFSGLDFIYMIDMKNTKVRTFGGSGTRTHSLKFKKNICFEIAFFKIISFGIVCFEVVFYLGDFLLHVKLNCSKINWQLSSCILTSRLSIKKCQELVPTCYRNCFKYVYNVGQY